MPRSLQILPDPSRSFEILPRIWAGAQEIFISMCISGVAGYAGPRTGRRAKGTTARINPSWTATTPNCYPKLLPQTMTPNYDSKLLAQTVTPNYYPKLLAQTIGPNSYPKLSPQTITPNCNPKLDRYRPKRSGPAHAQGMCGCARLQLDGLVIGSDEDPPPPHPHGPHRRRHPRQYPPRPPHSTPAPQIPSPPPFVLPSRSFPTGS